MSEREQSATEALATSFQGEWWVDETSVDEETDAIELTTSEAPDMRNVYRTVERLGDEGTVTVDGPSGSWAVEYAKGDVRDVKRVGGAYTVQRLSLLERFFQGLNMFGVYVIFAAIVTAVASFFSTTPLSLVDVGTLLSGPTGEF